MYLHLIKLRGSFIFSLIIHVFHVTPTKNQIFRVRDIDDVWFYHQVAIQTILALALRTLVVCPGRIATSLMGTQKRYALHSVMIILDHLGLCW